MKKLSILLIMGAMCAGLLVGCGSTATESSTSSDTASTVSSEVSSATDSSATEESSTPASSDEASTTPETPASDGDVSVEMILDETKGDNVGQFVKVVGADNNAITEINNQIETLMKQYQTESTKGDGSWAEYRTYTNKNSKYLNIVMLYNVYPTYGTQGNLTSFTYDIENQKLLDTTDVYTNIINKAERAVVSAFEDYYRDVDTAHQYRQINFFDVVGFSVYDNNQADLYLQVETDDRDDAPDEYRTSSSNELYIYHSDDGSIEPLKGDKLFVNNGRQVF